MRWLLIITTILISACTINYHDERSRIPVIYRISAEEAGAVVKDVLIKSENDGELDAYESTASGYLFRVRKIESEVVLKPISKNDGAYLGVALDISGSGDYLSIKMPPKDFQQTMMLIEKIRSALEKASSGVIRRDAKQIIFDTYP